jgi:hypothetical protein
MQRGETAEPWQNCGDLARLDKLDFDGKLLQGKLPQLAVSPQLRQKAMPRRFQDWLHSGSEVVCRETRLPVSCFSSATRLHAQSKENKACLGHVSIG